MNAFYLPSKRLIQIESISISSIYSTLVEGSPDHASNTYRKHFAEKLSRHRGQELVIVEYPEGRLPSYQVVANLLSDPIVRGDFYSHVTICWFQQSLDGNMVEFVRKITADLDWEKHAKGWGG